MQPLRVMLQNTRHQSMEMLGMRVGKRWASGQLGPCGSNYALKYIKLIKEI